MGKAIWVDAHDLDAWANRRQAQEELPRVVRRLVHATIERPRRVAFSGGEGVQLGGWDGQVEVEDGNACVPPGRSGWELSVQREIASKASEDYEKRKGAPGDLIPRETTFIFATARRWPGKACWARERVEERFWADVKAYDADDLEQWLEIAPAVQAWLARLIGKAPPGAVDPEEWWEEWSLETTPPIAPDLLLAGREESTKRILEWLEGRPGVLSLRASSRDEAIAFFLATLQLAEEPRREHYLARCVLASEIESWRDLVRGREGLVLIPQFEDLQGVVAAGRRHHVFIPVGAETPPGRGILDLPALAREQAIAVLTKDIGDERARKLVRSARGQLSVLRRLIAAAPAVAVPLWARPENGRALVPAILAGAWNEAIEEDRRALEKIARDAYEPILKVVARWVNEADAPIRRTGDVWQIASRDDSWTVLARYIGKDDLDAFENVAIGVLSTPHPRYDLQSGERWLAGVKGKHLPFSDHLREGLAETLALLSAKTSPADVRDAVRPQDRVNAIVRAVLGTHDWKRWATVVPLLPVLIEAAPEVVLGAVETGFAGERPPLVELFQEEEGGLGAPPYLTGLLWALERAAWEPRYLTRVTLLLGCLAALDPGGRWNNRPGESLRGIFLGWDPQTEASLEERLAAIDVLAGRFPDVAWSLLCALLPKTGGDWGHPHEKPRWRPWGSAVQERPTNAEYWKHVEAAGVRLLRLVGTSGKRWADIIQLLPSLLPAQRQEAITKLERLSTESASQGEALAIWNALRRAIHEHRRFSDAGWALPAEIVDRLARVYLRLEPTSLLDRYAHLFSTQPALTEAIERDWNMEHEAIATARSKAIEDILAADSDLLLPMVERVEVPYYLGFALGQHELPRGIEVSVTDFSLAADTWTGTTFALGFFRGRFRAHGWHRIEEEVVRLKATRPEAQVARLLLGAPFEPRTWDSAATLGKEGDRSYWERVEVSPIDEPTSLERAVRKLIDVGRPHGAIELIGMALDVAAAKLAVPTSLAIEALESAAGKSSADERYAAGTFTYRVEQILSVLEQKPEVPPVNIGRIEWLYLPVLERTQRPPRVLHKALAESPALFTEVIGLVFRPERKPGEADEAQEKPSPDEVARARRGYHLLDGWQTVPGLTDNGNVDEAALREWITEVRRRCDESGHRRIAADRVGYVLAHAPKEPDGTWPAISIRNVIEDVADREFEVGMVVGVLNKRGTITKQIGEGGEQERALAAQYRAWSEALAVRWPKTSSILARIAEDYEGNARREDIRSKLSDE